MASLILVVNVVGELQQKRTLAASRGFLAAARLSCLIIHTFMANAVARAYNGGLGAEPPAGVQGTEPPVRGQGDEVFVLIALIFQCICYAFA